MKKKWISLLAAFVAVLVCGGVFSACDDIGNTGKERTVVTCYGLYDENIAKTYTVFDGTFPLDSPPHRDHLTFLGFFDAEVGGTQIVDEYGICHIYIENDMTLWAHWQGNECNIVFDAGEGTLSQDLEEMSLIYGSTLSLFPVPQREGYAFVGWTSEGNLVSEESVVTKPLFDSQNYTFTPGSDTVVLRALYEVKHYTLTLDYNDGSYRNDTVTVDHGSTIASVFLPANDTGSSMIVGWSTERTRLVEFSGTFDSDITLYAIWRDYKVFRLYTDEETFTSQKVFRDEEYILPEVTRYGYEFDGWYASPYFSGIPAERVNYGSAYDSYYAKWVATKYRITFVLNGGDAQLDTMTYTIEESVKLPDAGKKQYCEFVGWCRNDDLSDPPFDFLEEGSSGDLTLYAKWKGEDRTVILDPADGYVSDTRRTVEYGASYSLGMAVKDGYEFQGWFTEDELQMTDKRGESLSDWSISDEETTLYAKYLKKFYITVSYSHEGAGTVLVKEYYVAGEKVVLSVQVTDPGYQVIGFYSDSDRVASGMEYRFDMPESDVALRVAFEPREFIVSFDSAEGYLKAEPVKIRYLDEFSFPVAFKQGFLFNGWSYREKLITDNTGKGLTVWTIKDDVTLTATYVEDPDAAGKILIFNSDTFADIAVDPSKTYVVVSDIDMSGKAWTPCEFSGTLIGNGFTIKNLSVSSGGGNAGVFSVVSGTVGDLIFENLTVVSSDYANVFVGGVCGELKGRLNNVKVIGGSVSGKTSFIGGIAGKMSSGTLNGCVNSAQVTGEANDMEGGAAGGICGWFAGGDLSDCENRGKVENKRFTGGIAGYATALGFGNLKNYGEVNGKDNVGGIFGNFEYGGDMNISGLSNEGDITGENCVGGLIGRLFDRTANTNHTLNLNRLSNRAIIQGNENVGGIMGYLFAEDNRSYNSYTIKITATELENEGALKGIAYVGGLFGYVYTDTGSSVVQNSNSSASVEAEYFLGGLIGYSGNLKIADCSNSGTTIMATGKLADGNNYFAYVGGYVGCGYSVSGCENHAEIVYSEIGNYVGGIAGYANGDFEDCKNFAAINASKASGVGGIVGYQDRRGNLSMRSLENSGHITGKDEVGGIIGRLYNRTEDNNHTITMARFTNSGTVMGNMNVGGTIGYLFADDVKSYNSYAITWNASALVNTGNITGTAYVGGLIGYGNTDSSSSKISESNSSGTITAEYLIGGLGGYLRNIMIESSSNRDSEIIATGSMVDNGVYYAYVGGYVGQGYTINGAVNESVILYNGRGCYVGGIAGYANGDLDSDSNTATVSAEKADYIGGIVGYQNKWGDMSIKNLSNSGKIVGKNYTGGIIGGLYDVTEDNNHTITVNVLSNTGAVTGAQYTAGIFGYFFAEDVRSYYSYTIMVTAMQLTNEGDVCGTTDVGGLWGYAYSDSGNSKTGNSRSSGTIQAESRVGGLAGYLLNIQIESCENEGSQIIATGYIIEGSSFYAYVGGYVGQGYLVKDCENASSIVYDKRGSYVGGIAGYTYGDIVDCKNTAEINAAQSMGVGGIVGYSNGAAYTMSNLTNCGKVVGKECVGGIVGRVYAHTSDANHQITVRRLTNESDISGENYVGGIFGYFFVEDVKSYYSYSITMTATEISVQGNISGTEHVGGIVGYFYSDGGSSITGYQMSGDVTGTGSYVNELAGEMINLAINE